MELFEKREGPKEVVIPEQRFLSCWGCVHYDHRMLKSGFNPIYADICEHPDLEPHMKYYMLEGNLTSNKTPEWCPCLIKTKEQ